METLLTALINQVNDISREMILVLDDYHLINAQPVNEALSFLLDHQPAELHLVISTRSDPRLPIARKSDKPEPKKGVVYSLFAYYLVSTILLVITQLAGLMNALGWGVIGIHMVLLVWFRYFLVSRSALAQWDTANAT
jgi:hypothetical protein